ncbi:NADP-dependent oxidoreductase [Micromonospora sp. NPDC004336]
MSRRLMHESFDGIDAVRLVDEPPAPLGPSQLRVRIAAAGLNPVDWQITESPSLARMFGVELPAGYGNDFAGVVEEVGPDVTDFRVGDRVFGGARARAVAEHAVVDARRDRIRRTPPGLDDVTAATLDIAGRTASAVVDALRPGPGDTVLVGAAAGGVGVFAVQLARRAGARVIGTASPSTFDFLRGLGADPVAYGPGLADRVRELAPEGVTAAADLFGTETALAALDLGVPAHRIATIEAEDPPGGARGVNGSDARPDALERLAALVESGELRVPVAATYPLDRYHEALVLQKARHAHGKVVITMDRPAS